MLLELSQSLSTAERYHGTVHTYFHLAPDPLEAVHFRLLNSGRHLADGGFCSVFEVSFPSPFETEWTGKAETHGAMKVLPKKTTQLTQWLNEIEVLRKLEEYDHPNIVKLLYSYSVRDSYVLLFPLATCDLDYLMMSDPPSPGMMGWAVKQMVGLTKALEYLHYGNESMNAWGRHGDLKPANILWYESEQPSVRAEPSFGTLVIADLGLATFRRRPSLKHCSPRIAILDTGVSSPSVADPQYAPPETEIPLQSQRASRAYDIWSLGCIFLEFLIWMLEGPPGREKLLQQLGSFQKEQPDHSPSYWYMEPTPLGPRFSLNPRVSASMQRLLELAKEDPLADAVATILVYGGLLDPNPDARPTAKDLGRMLAAVESGTLIEGQSCRQRPPAWSRMWTWEYSNWKMIRDEEPPLKQKCPFCNDVGRPVALKYHIYAYHRNRGLQECSRCGYLFEDNKQLTEHRLQGLSRSLSCAFPLSIQPLASDTNTMTGQSDGLSDQKTWTTEYPSRSNSHGMGSSLQERLAPSAGPPKMRSGSGKVKRYHTDDDLSGGPVVR